MTRIPLIFFLALISDFLAALWGLMRYPKLSPAMKIFAVNLVVSFLSEFGLVYLGLNKLNNLWIVHLSTPIEFILLVMFLAEIEPRPVIRSMMRAAIPVYLLFFLWSEFTLEPLQTYNGISRGVSAFILVLFAGIELFRIFTNSDGAIWRSAPFVAASAIIIVFAMGMTIYVTSNKVAILPFELATIPWEVNAFSGIAANCLCIYSLFQRS
jgi:hypothetical protein